MCFMGYRSRLLAVLMVSVSCVMVVVSCTRPVVQQVSLSPTVSGTVTLEGTPTMPSSEEIAAEVTVSSPTPTHTATWTPTSTPTFTPTPTSTPTPSPSPTPTVEPSPTPRSLQPLPLLSSSSFAMPTPLVPAAAPVVLTPIPDTDPAPPLTVLVHTIRVEDNSHTRLTGVVRNDGAETYEGVGIHASFIRQDGRGFGPIEVYCPCLFVEPRATCPFVLDAAAADFIAYRLHVQGHPLHAGQPASVAVRVSEVSRDAIGNVRITGVVVNEHPFNVRDVNVIGALLDPNDQVVSAGWTFVASELAAGGSASFVLRVAYRPYARYEVFSQALQY